MLRAGIDVCRWSVGYTTQAVAKIRLFWKYIDSKKDRLCLLDHPCAGYDSWLCRGAHAANHDGEYPKSAILARGDATIKANGRRRRVFGAIRC